jgi:hypothetical protein
VGELSSSARAIHPGELGLYGRRLPPGQHLTADFPVLQAELPGAQATCSGGVASSNAVLMNNFHGSNHHNA